MEKTKYSSVSSEFLKVKIQETNWTNHQYIDDLLILKQYIDEGVNGYISAIHFHKLKTKYHQDYLDLTKEISTDRFLKAQKELSDKNQEEKQLELLKKLQEEKELDDWKKAGGKL